MKKQIQHYLSEIKSILEADSNDTDWTAVSEKHLIKIGFYQHERLIHLIVTVLFAIMEIISLFAFFVTEYIFMLILAVAVLILLIPYVFHYYFLENSVQKLYLIYDKIQDKMNK